MMLTLVLLVILLWPLKINLTSGFFIFLFMVTSRGIVFICSATLIYLFFCILAYCFFIACFIQTFFSSQIQKYSPLLFDLSSNIQIFLLKVLNFQIVTIFSLINYCYIVIFCILLLCIEVIRSCLRSQITFE